MVDALCLSVIKRHLDNVLSDTSELLIGPVVVRLLDLMMFEGSFQRNCSVLFYTVLFSSIENSSMFVFLDQSYDILIGMMKYRNASLKQEKRKRKLFSAKTNHSVPFVCLYSEIKPHLSAWAVWLFCAYDFFMAAFP